jgi:(2R)-3-sulfolactate dehydrogenase (NADP+)
LTVDAANGFAHPAIEAGMTSLISAAGSSGIAAMTLRRSYNCGVLGHHAEVIARAGLIGLCFTHAPASIAPPGGKTAVIGTNPLAIAVPASRGGITLCLDQSASVVAKSEIMRRALSSEPIPLGWALDEGGEPTTDAAKALRGTMLSAGGHKGFGMGLVAEILASALAGAAASREASPFSGSIGGPPSTGQCFVAIDPAAFAPGFGVRAKALVAAILAQPGARLPGSRRLAARAKTAMEGVRVDHALMERITA